MEYDNSNVLTIGTVGNLTALLTKINLLKMKLTCAMYPSVYYLYTPFQLLAI